MWNRQVNGRWGSRVCGGEGAGGELLSGEMRRKNLCWVLFLCGGPGVSLRGGSTADGRRASQLRGPQHSIWSLSNWRLIKLSSTFMSQSALVPASLSLLLISPHCSRTCLNIKPDLQPPLSCLLMAAGYHPPQWAACAYCAIRQCHMFSLVWRMENASGQTEIRWSCALCLCQSWTSHWALKLQLNNGQERKWKPQRNRLL